MGGSVVDLMSRRLRFVSVVASTSAPVACAWRAWLPWHERMLQTKCAPSQTKWIIHQPCLPCCVYWTIHPQMSVTFLEAASEGT